jgi:hypothetical protein
MKYEFNWLWHNTKKAYKFCDDNFMCRHTCACTPKVTCWNFCYSSQSHYVVFKKIKTWTSSSFQRHSTIICYVDPLAGHKVSPKFWSNILPPFSGSKSKPNKKTSRRRRWQAKLSLPAASVSFLLDSHFIPQDGGDTCLRDAGLSPDYMTLQTKKIIGVLAILSYPGIIQSIFQSLNKLLLNLFYFILIFPPWSSKWQPNHAPLSKCYA